MKYVPAALIALLPTLLLVMLMGPRMAVLVFPIAVVVACVYLSVTLGRRADRRS